MGGGRFGRRLLLACDQFFFIFDFFIILVFFLFILKTDTWAEAGLVGGSCSCGTSFFSFIFLIFSIFSYFEDGHLGGGRSGRRLLLAWDNFVLFFSFHFLFF